MGIFKSKQRRLAIMQAEQAETAPAASVGVAGRGCSCKGDCEALSAAEDMGAKIAMGAISKSVLILPKKQVEAIREHDAGDILSDNDITLLTPGEARKTNITKLLDEKNG
jgi:hypothetical protein